jgi:putative endonuclease
MKSYYVYILANKRNGALYLGVTNDLLRRVDEHKQKCVEGHSKKYGIDQLVYFEQTDDDRSAIVREKQLKGWRRSKKIALIERDNPDWVDLSPSLFSL